MAAILQTIFLNAFSWIKMCEFWLKCPWSLQHWFRQWLGAGQAISHCLNQWWLVYWRIYASIGLNELMIVLDTILIPNLHVISTLRRGAEIEKLALTIRSNIESTMRDKICTFNVMPKISIIGWNTKEYHTMKVRIRLDSIVHNFRDFSTISSK